MKYVHIYISGFCLPRIGIWSLSLLAVLFLFLDFVDAWKMKNRTTKLTHQVIYDHFYLANWCKLQVNNFICFPEIRGKYMYNPFLYNLFTRRLLNGLSTFQRQRWLDCGLPGHSFTCHWNSMVPFVFICSILRRVDGYVNKWTGIVKSMQITTDMTSWLQQYMCVQIQAQWQIFMK